jgi:hypothetical protein
MTASDVKEAGSVENGVPAGHADGSSEVRTDRERLRRYQETERELLTLLDAETVDEATRKRKLVSLFDRFRLEYTQLSVQLRESLRAQRKLMDKVRPPSWPPPRLLGPDVRVDGSASVCR